jgi:hypothetical protein
VLILLLLGGLHRQGEGGPEIVVVHIFDIETVVVVVVGGIGITVVRLIIIG